MASSSLISVVSQYEKYIESNGINESVVNAYIEAAQVALQTEKDVEYGLKISARAKQLAEKFIFDSTGGTAWDLEKFAFKNKVQYDKQNR